MINDAGSKFQLQKILRELEQLSSKIQIIEKNMNSIEKGLDEFFYTFDPESLIKDNHANKKRIERLELLISGFAKIIRRNMLELQNLEKIY